MIRFGPVEVTYYTHMVDRWPTSVWLWWRGRVVLEWDRWRGFRKGLC